jgi:two-component SAPR family response regulator
LVPEKSCSFAEAVSFGTPIDFLRPEADLASAANNLYKTIHALRQTLNTCLGQAASNAIFDFDDGVLSLALSVWVDVQEFERLCTGSDQRAADLEQALDFYKGDLLPDDRYEEWTLLPSLQVRRASVRRGSTSEPENPSMIRS